METRALHTTSSVLSHFSRVCLFETPWAVAHQAPLFMDSPGKNTGVGCHALFQGLFLTRDWTCVSSITTVGSLPLVPPGKPNSVLCKVLWVWHLLNPYSNITRYFFFIYKIKLRLAICNLSKALNRTRKPKLQNSTQVIFLLKSAVLVFDGQMLKSGLVN